MAISRGPLVAGVLFSLSCGGPNGLPPLPPRPEFAVTNNQLSGCYQHVAAATGEPRMSHTAPFTPPERFYLTNEANVGPDKLGKKIVQADSYGASGYWEYTGGDAIRLTWTNGSEGVQVTLHPSFSDRLWRGHTQGFSNMGGVVVFSYAVVVRRVWDGACR
jgi:hypothetical protein